MRSGQVCVSVSGCLLCLMVCKQLEKNAALRGNVARTGFEKKNATKN